MQRAIFHEAIQRNSSFQCRVLVSRSKKKKGEHAYNFLLCVGPKTIHMTLSRTVKGLNLPYLQVNKLTRLPQFHGCYRRYEIPHSETKDSILFTPTAVARVSIYILLLYSESSFSYGDTKRARWYLHIVDYIPLEKDPKFRECGSLVMGKTHAYCLL